jgi:hypothetical protein
MGLTFHWLKKKGERTRLSFLEDTWWRQQETTKQRRVPEGHSSSPLLLPGKLWVLRCTINLKTTDATLVSVDGPGAIGQRGTLVHLPYDSPETITEETPSATVTPTHCGNPMDVARLDLGRDRAQDQVLAQEQAISALHWQT